MATLAIWMAWKNATQCTASTAPLSREPPFESTESRPRTMQQRAQRERGDDGAAEHDRAGAGRSIHLPNRPANPNSTTAPCSADSAPRARSRRCRTGCRVKCHACIVRIAGCCSHRALRLFGVRGRIALRPPARVRRRRSGRLHAASHRRQEGARCRPRVAGQPRQGRGVRHRRRPARQVPAQGQVLLGRRGRLRLLRRRLRLGHGRPVLRQHDAHRLAQRLSRRAGAHRPRHAPQRAVGRRRAVLPRRVRHATERQRRRIRCARARR